MSLSDRDRAGAFEDLTVFSVQSRSDRAGAFEDLTVFSVQSRSDRAGAFEDRFASYPLMKLILTRDASYSRYL
ncbi:hypothetical protein NGM10_07810 [Halorussus salilacus]|uniref:hypothetical protein n=1 Tax=Halorussus salilacus TaxID=2953750 RepID=UPI0020A16A1B|nr:hypothetical protein [Halorussus salilacus]USZ69624.1 hypothetical protein NGM10_07810 [Halorussus salilacus]